MLNSQICKRAAFGALAGITIGCLLEVVFSASLSSTYVPGRPEFLSEFANANSAVAVERLIYALLGAVISAASLLFEIEKFSLLKATLSHMCVVITALVITAIYLKWIPAGWAIAGFILIGLGVYGVIWISIWLKIRADIREANKKLTSE